MAHPEDVQAAAQALLTADGPARQQAAANLERLARARASLLPVKDTLLLLLDDRDPQIRLDLALALLVDAWRFRGLLPVVDTLAKLSAGPRALRVGAALTTAASLRDDVARAAVVLVPILAEDLPSTAAALGRLAGQGADLTGILPAIEACQPTPATPVGREMGALWLSALAKAAPEHLTRRAEALQRWMDADELDWHFDDLRYRAAGLLALAELRGGDAAAVRALAEHDRYPVREAAIDVVATELIAGRHVALATGLLLAHTSDPAGGVRYGAIQGVVRAVAAGVDLQSSRHALAAMLDDAAYLATGWTHPLDPIATSDLGAESAAADLAAAVAALARKAGDAALLDSLRRHPQAQVMKAVQQF